MKRNPGTSVVATTIAGLFCVWMNTASGAGFSLIEQSASGMGNAFAGASAVAEDASTIYFNPAGMSFLEGSQFVAAGHAIGLDATFAGTANNPLALGGGPATGGNGGQIGDTGFVPNLYLSMPFGERWDFGIGINVPFGLITEYDANWVGRFQGVKSEITSININPAASYQLTDTISIGGGLNYQQLDAELTNAVVLGAGLEGDTKLEVDDDGWGWNIGAMFQLSSATRLGVSYRSEIDYGLQGNVTTLDATGAVVPAAGGPTQADVTLPDTFSLSIAHATTDRLELLGDVTRTGWSSIQTINIVNTTNGTLRDVLVLDFDDAWRYSIGGNYTLNDKWKLKAGLAFDETPVKGAASRTVRLPDNDRTWISFGGQVKVGKSSSIDLGYSHIFIKDADINNTKSQQAPGLTTPTPAPGTATTVTGSYEGSVDIFSVQYTLNF
jgi:long-chain fatty acid transport protein